MAIPIALPRIAAVLTLLACSPKARSNPPGSESNYAAAVPQVPLSGGINVRSVDLGSVRAEDEVTYVFDALNDTGKPVVVEKVSASCGCSSAVLSRLSIDPDGVDQLTIKVRTGAFPGLKTVDAWLDGTANGQPVKFDFALAMHVRQVVVFPDSNLEFMIGRRDVTSLPIQYDVPILKGPYPMQWDGLIVEADNPQLTALVVPQGADKWRVRLTIDPLRRIGRFAANLKFHVLNGKIDTGYAVSRRVSAIIAGAVRAAPNSWLIGQGSPGQPVEQSIHVISTGDSDEQAELLDATASNPKTVEIVKNPAEKDRFTIRYKPPQALGPDSGYVDARVSTRHGNYTMRIPYLALVVSPDPQPSAPTPTLAKPKEDDPTP
jgi:Protein of unknown function (DUF1573)